MWHERIELLSIVEAYAAAKEKIDAVDYTDLVARAHRLVTERPEIAERIRDRYRVILLDEYQDTDPAQRELLRTIFGDGFPVTAVGDSDQTIYEWRGASRLNFDGFPAHFANVDGTEALTLPLTLNRRSDRIILDLANQVRSRLHGDAGFDALAPAPGAGPGTVETAWLGTRSDEAVWIADRIGAIHDEGTPWNAIAVLVRKNRDIGPVRDALARAGIPTEVASVGGLLDVPEVTDLYAWLQILHDPADTVALARLILGASYRLGLGDVAHLREWARADARSEGREPSLINAIEHVEGIDGLSAQAAERLTRFRGLFRDLVVDAQVSSPGGLCRTILASTNAWTEIDAMEESAALSARLNLYRFLDLAESWTPLSGGRTLSGFLRHLDILSDESAPEELDTATLSREAAVPLLTIHRAKGLEWDTVVIPSVVDGGFPSQSRGYANPVDKPEYLPYALRLDADTLPHLDAAPNKKARDAILRGYHEQEEWRAAYVAVTRARHRLVVTGSYRTPERKNPRKPSPLFTMAEGLADDRTIHEDPGPIEDVPWQAAPPAPDPLFGDEGWVTALQSATEDANWLDAYPGYREQATADAGQMRLAIEALPQPTTPAPALKKTTSVTGLVTLARCPLRFQWAFVDRLPTRPSPALRKGVDFHRKVELHNLGKVPLDDLDDTVYDVAEEWEGDGTAPKAAPYDVFLESRFFDERARHAEVPIDLTIGDVRVRGRVDAVYEPEPGTWEIVDYKSGRPSDDPALDVQLQTYAIAAADGALGSPIPERISVTFAFFGGGTYGERTIEADDAWLAAARSRVEDLAARFSHEAFEPTPSKACRTCDFLHLCEAGKAFLAR
ncbi:MAG: ATP-dependent DNA helicase [Planctomycetota bacterium]